MKLKAVYPERSLLYTNESRQGRYGLCYPSLERGCLLLSI